MRAGTGGGRERMAQRTRLFQAAGSPLIQGRSKTRRPVWQEIAQCLVLTVVAMVAYRVAAVAVFTDAPNSEVFAQIQPAALLALGVGAVVGTAVVVVARSMGGNRAWLAGAASSVLLCVIIWGLVPAVR